MLSVLKNSIESKKCDRQFLLHRVLFIAYMFQNDKLLFYNLNGKYSNVIQSLSVTLT